MPAETYTCCRTVFFDFEETRCSTLTIAIAAAAIAEKER